jgi:hypothetical protein
LDLDSIGNTVFAGIAPNLKTQREMERRRKTSKHQMVKSTMLGWFILMAVMHLPEKGVKMLRKATKKSP